MRFLLMHPKYLRISIQNLCISLLLIGLSTSAIAETREPSGQLTLSDALSLAVNANPEIAVALREREAIEGMKTQAAVRPNPSISTSIQDTRSANRQTSLQLNQEIELGNKREARVEAADSFYSKANAELDNKKAEIHANVIAAFYEVLVAQERLSLAKSSLEVANLARDAAGKRVKAGKSSPVEETKSKIAESTAKIELTQAATQLEGSRKRLAALWGSVLPVFESAKGDVAYIPETIAFTELASMLENAPAIKLAKIEIDTRGALTKVERSKGTPNVTISAGVVNNQELGGINQALLGLSVPIPLFDRNQGNLQEAVSRQYKAQDELVALKNQLAVNLSGQYEQLNAARQAAESFRVEILPGAQSAFDAANKGFSAGKFNFLDVLDAQRTLVQAKSQYIQALLEAHQAVAEIERILGDVIVHQSRSKDAI
ncbi:MAG TPA: TolC family protein [Methylotenera sp.]|nr:TolC family protein [Methylotenera sp.]